MRDGVVVSCLETKSRSRHGSDLRVVLQEHPAQVPRLQRERRAQRAAQQLAREQHPVSV